MRILLLLILNLFIISSVFGQTRCDTLDSYIYVITEIVPTSNITYNQLENLLNESISIDNYGLSDGDMIYLGFTINCKGEDFDYFAHGQIDIELQEKIFGIIQSNMNWTPAIMRKKKVDFQKSMLIRIDGARFNVLDEKESKRNKKRKK